MSIVSDLRLILRGRDFRRLFTTRLVSQTSDGMFQMAVAGYAFFSPERQTDPRQAAMAFAVLLLPYSLLGPFAGVFIDRWSRRQILVIAPILRGLLIFAAAVLLVSGGDSSVFYIVALAVLAVNRFFLAALGASLPHVVPRSHLVLANSMVPTAGTLFTFLGVGIAFLLRKFALGADDVGIAKLLILSGLLFGASALVARTLGRDLLGPDFDPDRPQTREALRNVLRGLVDGARHVWSRGTATAALGAMALARCMFGLLTLMAVVLYRNYFHSGDAEAGLTEFAPVVAASAAGFFAAAVLTPWATRRMRIDTWVMSLLTTVALADAVLLPFFHQIPIMIVAFVAGVATQGIKICADTIVQRDVQDAYLGRVFSIYDMLFNGMFTVGAAIAALMLPANGRSYAVVAVSVASYALGAILYGFAGRSRSRVALRTGRQRAGR